MTNWKIAVDAMGGDFAPRNVVQGAIVARREYGVSLALVGREAELQRELGSEKGGIEIVDAPEVVAMDEPALTPIRKKKESSIRVAAELVKEGRAAGFVSAGNTGASMAIAKRWRSFVMGGAPRRRSRMRSEWRTTSSVVEAMSESTKGSAS